MQTLAKIKIWLVSALVINFALNIPVFAVETIIPDNVNVYSWVYKQFDKTDVQKILGEEEASIKALAQNAFNRFRQDERVNNKNEKEKSELALEHLKTLVNDLYNVEEDRTSRIRIRLIDKALDGVGDDYVRWFG